MFYLGLPIKNGGSFHGYVSHNQMVIYQTRLSIYLSHKDVPQWVQIVFLTWRWLAACKMLSWISIWSICLLLENAVLRTASMVRLGILVIHYGESQNVLHWVVNPWAVEMLHERLKWTSLDRIYMVWWSCCSILYFICCSALMECFWVAAEIYPRYPAIKHGNGKSPINGDVTIWLWLT